MVFVNELPVANDWSQARTVDHERNAELFSEKGYYLDEENDIKNWRLNWDGKDIFISGKLKYKTVCEDGTLWTPQNQKKVIDTFAYYQITSLRIPSSLKSKFEIYDLIKESIEVNKFSFGNPAYKTRSVTITGIELAHVQYYQG